MNNCVTIMNNNYVMNFSDQTYTRNMLHLSETDFDKKNKYRVS